MKKKKKKRLVHFSMTDSMHVGFFIHTSMKRKNSTVISYNLISNHFHAKLKGKQL